MLFGNCQGEEEWRIENGELKMELVPTFSILHFQLQINIWPYVVAISVELCDDFDDLYRFVHYPK